MKQTFYKIIAIASVLLGALGPQVASGSTVISATQPASQLEVRNHSLIVSDIPTAPTVLKIQSQGGQNCLITTGNIRFDQMLLNGCETFSIAFPVQQTLPKIVVTNQPQYLPTLALQKTISLTVQVSLNSGSNRNDLTLPNINFNFKIAIKGTPVDFTSTKNNSLNVSISNQDNDLQTIVMRC